MDSIITQEISISTTNYGAVVAKHYNRLEEKGRELRDRSKIFHLRNFNNWIKSVLIGDVVKRMREHGVRDLVILDLCCGKGGDILKWVKTNMTRRVVFVDIAETSVKQCKDRYYSSERNRFDAEFYTADCTKERLKLKYSDPNIVFNIVSVQFSFHYCFESLPQAQMMLKNISECLQPGGYFIGTLPNANRIVKRVRRTGTKEYKNNILRIRFDDIEPFKIFGTKYYFQLDEVVNCPEFLVNFPSFVRLAKKHGLELVFNKPFEKVFDRKLNAAHFLLQQMKGLETFPPEEGKELYSNVAGEYKDAQNFYKEWHWSYRHPFGTLSKSEWEVATLYTAFVFEKV